MHFVEYGVLCFLSFCHSYTNNNNNQTSYHSQIYNFSTRVFTKCFTKQEEVNIKRDKRENVKWLGLICLINPPGSDSLFRHFSRLNYLCLNPFVNVISENQVL